MKRLYPVFLLLVVSSLLLFPRGASTEDRPAGGAPGDHVMLTETDMKWVEGPQSLPAGAMLAMLEGDPAKEGPFTMRLKMPAGYRIPPHTHPGIEHVTVMSGSLWLGSGATFDDAAMKEMPAGSFAAMPKGMKHYAMAKNETVVQVHGMGPWGIDYLNPNDDPRKK